VAPAAEALAPLVHAVHPRRALVGRNMERGSGAELAPPARRRAARAAFASYLRYWLEALALPSLSPAEVDAAFAIDGLEHLKDAVAKGRGAILALPHVGSWDVGGAWLVRQGFPLTVVVGALEPPELFEWFRELRGRMGLKVVALGGGAGAAVLRTLRANEVVALLCDRDIEGGGVEVELFGERTTLPAGPATLALRTGAALMPTAVYFEGRGHHAVIEEPLPVERGGRIRDDVARVTQLLAHRLEALIRRAPEQWHLFQPNWPSDRER
jgi:KDO2-lipid IV(A) lauroyltransferase